MPNKKNIPEEVVAKIAAPLPLLTNAKPAARLDLFAKKLRFCCYTFNFQDPYCQIKEKDLKTIYLKEVVEFMEESRGVLIEPIYAMCFTMIAHNLFQAVHPSNPTFDPDEDDPIVVPEWPHLQLVYAFFFRVLESPDFQPSEAKKYIDHSFVTNLINRFASEDINERECLKTSLHRIYGKFLGLRAFIRNVVNNKFLEMVYEDLYFPGVTEILEVLGSIINGYTCPLKREHKQFLFQILLPLHSTRYLQQYQAQLVYCVVQYLEKDSSLTEEFVTKFLKRWPRTVTPKEVMFLGELEEIIDVLQPSEFIKVQRVVFVQLAKCIKSEHFQVAERALYFWDNEYIVSLMEVSSTQIFPLVLPSLLQVSNFHWNSTIITMSTNVIKNFMTVNQKFFTTILGNIKQKKRQEKKHRAELTAKWEKLDAIASQSDMKSSFLTLDSDGVKNKS